jgi:HK97 gp10 family phage protein
VKVIATVKVEGLRELAATLDQLPKAVARNALRRALIKRGQPLADTMRSLAPDDPRTGGMDLRNSIGVGTKLSPRQAKLHRKENKDDKQFAEVFVGAGPVPHAHLQEWGTVFHGPQPFARPAWDQHKDTILEGIKDDLWAEIDKAAKRHAKKLARLAAKGG